MRVSGDSRSSRGLGDGHFGDKKRRLDRLPLLDRRRLLRSALAMYLNIFLPPVIIFQVSLRSPLHNTNQNRKTNTRGRRHWWRVAQATRGAATRAEGAVVGRRRRGYGCLVPPLLVRRTTWRWRRRRWKGREETAGPARQTARRTHHCRTAAKTAAGQGRRREQRAVGTGASRVSLGQGLGKQQGPRRRQRRMGRRQRGRGRRRARAEQQRGRPPR